MPGDRSERGKNRIVRGLQVGGGIAIGALFLVLLCTQFNLRAVTGVTESVTIGWILLALVALAAGYSCRIERWRLMLSDSNPDLKWPMCAGPFLASVSANNLLSLRARHALRTFSFTQQLRTTPGVVLTTLFVERALDLFTVLALLAGALALVHYDAGRSTSTGSLPALAGAALILLGRLFSRVLGSVFLKAGNIVARRWPRAGQRLVREINPGINTLDFPVGRGAMGKLLAWTFSAWVLEMTVYCLTAASLPNTLAALGGVLALPVSALSTMLPSAPGYVGTFDFLAVKSMVEAGNSTESGAALAIMVHIIIWFPITLSGAVCWVMTQNGARGTSSRTRRSS